MMVCRREILLGLAFSLALFTLVLAEEGSINEDDLIVDAGSVSTGAIVTRKETVAEIKAEDVLGKIAELKGLLETAEAAIKKFLGANVDQVDWEYHCKGGDIKIMRAAAADIEEALSKCRASALSLSLFYTSNLLNGDTGIYNLSTKSYLHILRAYDETLEVISRYNMIGTFANNATFDEQWTTMGSVKILPNGLEFITVPRLGLLASKHYDEKVVRQEIARGDRTTVIERNEYVKTTNFFKLVMGKEDEAFVKDTVSKEKAGSLASAVARLQAIRKEVRLTVRKMDGEEWEVEYGKNGKKDYLASVKLLAEFLVTFVRSQSKLNRLKFLVTGEAYDYADGAQKATIKTLETELRELHAWGTRTWIVFDTQHWVPSNNYKMLPLPGMKDNLRLFLDLNFDFGFGNTGFVANVGFGTGYHTTNANSPYRRNLPTMRYIDFYDTVKNYSNSYTQKVVCVRKVLSKWRVTITLYQMSEMASALFYQSSKQTFIDLMTDHISQAQ